MKALTLWQPWASLIAAKVKWIETRGWSTTYRGSLAIHAAKRQPDQARRVGDFVVGWEYEPPSHPVLFEQPAGKPWPQLPNNGGCDRSRCCTRDLPLGAVVATCRLLDVVPIRDSYDHDTSGDYIIVDQGHPATVGLGFRDGGVADAADTCYGMLDQVPYGDYTPGRFAWLLGVIKPIDPVPTKGHQGLWEWTP